MKKLLAIVLVLSILASPALAVGAVNTPRPVQHNTGQLRGGTDDAPVVTPGPTAAQGQSKSYTIEGLTFRIPTGFSLSQNDNGSMLFSHGLLGRTTLRVALLDGTGLDLEGAAKMFQYSFPVADLTYDADVCVNDLPYVSVEFSDASVPTYGRAALFLDTKAENVFVFLYQSADALTDEDLNSWQALLDSIVAPDIYKQVLDSATPSPTPTPDPTPTPAPTPEPFNYDAVNRNPDKYKDQFFTISGEVVQIVEEPFEDEGGAYSDTTLVGARIATKGHYDDMIYVFYYRNPGEDRILEGDKITFEGVGFGLYTYESVEHISITLPLFLLTKVVEIK